MKHFLSFSAVIAAAFLVTSAFTSDKGLTYSKMQTERILAEKTIDGSRVVFTQVVKLDAENEALPVDSRAQGIAILRITDDMKLYSKVIVQKAEEDDGMLTAAHIHTQNPGALTGPVLVGLTQTADDFGRNVVIQLTERQYNIIVNGDEPLYVNAHSTVYPPGLVRGQIR